MDLSKTVQAELNKLIDEGAVQAIIKTQLESTIKSIFNSSLREYSDFGKELEKVVKQSLQIDLSKISVLKYQQIVTDIVKEQMQKSILENVKQPLDKALSDLLSPLEDRVYKLSEIVEEFKKQECSNETEGELTLIVEHSTYGSIHVYLDSKSDIERYNCAYNFSLSNRDNKIYHFNLERRRAGMDVRKENISGRFDNLLFNLYASGTVLDIDEGHCQTEWWND